MHETLQDKAISNFESILSNSKMKHDIMILQLKVSTTSVIEEKIER
jgi:hypothetical protein